MLATDLLIIIALCLAALVAVAVRMALSLKDIGAALERIAGRLDSEGGTTAQGAAKRGAAPPEAPAAAAGTEAGGDAEIVAAIAAAARARSADQAGDDAARLGGERTTK